MLIDQQFLSSLKSEFKPFAKQSPAEWCKVNEIDEKALRTHTALDPFLLAGFTLGFEAHKKLTKMQAEADLNEYPSDQ